MNDGVILEMRDELGQGEFNYELCDGKITWALRPKIVRYPYPDGVLYL
jgi:hypothetical protein